MKATHWKTFGIWTNLAIFLKVSLQRVSWERKTSKGWQKIETRNNCFFVNAAGEKVDQPIIIWKSQLPWYFKKLQDTWHPANVHYFWNPKSWITSQVMEVVLARFKKACIWGQKSHYFSRQCHVQNLWLISFPRSKFSSYQIIQLRGYNHWMLASKISR